MGPFYWSWEASIPSLALDIAPIIFPTKMAWRMAAAAVPEPINCGLVYENRRCIKIIMGYLCYYLMMPSTGGHDEIS